MNWDIDYNTGLDELVISEYGRTVQELLRNANTIETDEERQAYVERVIQLMLQMQPSIKQQENYEERLWKHAFAIAGDKLKVTVPEGINVDPEEERPQPEPLPYPSADKQRRAHYGKNVLALIEAGKKMDDGPERDLLTYTAAYYMKVALTDWRGGKFFNEDMIRRDLYEISEKTLVLPPDAKIGEPTGNQPSQDTGNRRKKKKKKGGGNNNNSNRSSGRRRGRRRRR